MKVLKFGGTSVGTPERMRHVASLVRESGRNIVVLSAMSGTTNSLVEISDYLHKHNVPGAQETVNSLRQKYASVVDELYSQKNSKQRATEYLDRIFNFILRFTEGEFGVAEEKRYLHRAS